MIYIFAGEDSFESLKKAKEKLFSISESNIIGYNTLSADDVLDLDVILQQLEGIDMFADKKPLFLKRLLNNKKFVEYFANNFDQLNKFDIVIWQDGKADSRTKFVKEVIKNKNFYNYDSPKEGEMKAWIRNYANTLKIKLSTENINFIFERIQFNKFRIESELQKFRLFLNTEKKELLKDSEINDIMGYSAGGDVWKFVEYFSSRSKLKLLQEFKKLTTFEENTQLLLSLVNRELRLMLQYKLCKLEGVDTSELKLHPFVLKKVAEKSRNFSIEELNKLIQELFNVDFSVKSGTIPEKSAFILFLASM